jgi:hypothetical protein
MTDELSAKIAEPKDVPAASDQHEDPTQPEPAEPAPAEPEAEPRAGEPEAEPKGDDGDCLVKAWEQGWIEDAEQMRRCSLPGTDVEAVLALKRALFRPTPERGPE